jgi:nitrate reductase gamma subunit
LCGTGFRVRRRRQARCRREAREPQSNPTTTRNDTLMYAVLACALMAGLCCTLAGATHFGELHDYRQRVSVWFRSIWILDPGGT